MQRKVSARDIKAPKTIIKCEDLTVAYGREVILHEVNLDIPSGVFLPIIGPNGSGKTTLLRAILGLLKPRGGRIITPFHRSPPGYVPQQKAIDPLYPVSVRQIVMMGMYPKLGWWRRPNNKEKKAVDAILMRLKLLEHSEKRYSELSGGMKQKTLIARALVGDSEVLIMDEPTSELDEDSEKDIITTLSRISKEEGHTVLLAIHNLEHVRNISSIICRVDHGHVALRDIGNPLSHRKGEE
jgi:ABC-type Mn2+/Zn2+ transport system ATPase subunit